jgi:hypothetical protein
MADQNDLLENRIRERAFQLWQEAGCPETRAKEFWYRAQEVETKSAEHVADPNEDDGPHDPPTGDTQNFA